MEQHYLKSSYREKLIEHLLIVEMLKLSSTSSTCALEISKPEADNKGYNLISDESLVIRPIQIKTEKHIERKKVDIKTRRLSLSTYAKGIVEVG